MVSDKIKSALAVALLVSGAGILGLALYNDYKAEVAANKVQATVENVANTVVNRVSNRIGDHVELPNDASEWYTTVVYDGLRNQAVVWFDNEPRLKSLKSQTHYNVYLNTDPMYRDRIAAWTGPVAACVIVQDGSGKVVYKMSNDNMPTSADELADGIQNAINDYVSPLSGSVGSWNVNPYNPNCPDCRPKPIPQPVPTPVQPVNVVPDLGGPKPAVDDPTVSIGWALGAGLFVGGLMMLVYYIRKDAGNSFPGI